MWPCSWRSFVTTKPWTKEEGAKKFARRKPDLVARYMAEFSKPRYAVDILKVEAPVNMKFVSIARFWGQSGLLAR